MSTRRTRPSAPRTAIQLSVDGTSLCRWCAQPVAGRRRTFCSELCVREWKLRSDPGFLRKAVFARDHGRCGVCALDTQHLVGELRRLRRRDRERWRKRMAMLGIGRRTSLWDADHVTPVAEGGGECDLSNMRTLCVWCHRRATGDLRQRLRSATDATILRSPDAVARHETSDVTALARRSDA